jgi:tRNA (cytidine/uridine-2'-O-)-methyltransferase
MLHICLFEPEIPPNTGNIIRLCANVGAQLHLIHPLGFTLDSKQVKRAGLDYHDLAKVSQYDSWQDFCSKHVGKRIFALTTKGVTNYTDIKYQNNDVLLFGPETRGLPQQIREDIRICELIRIPMASSSRSLNLSNSVSIVAYAAWHQHGFTSLC